MFKHLNDLLGADKNCKCPRAPTGAGEGKRAVHMTMNAALVSHIILNLRRIIISVQYNPQIVADGYNKNDMVTAVTQEVYLG